VNDDNRPAVRDWHTTALVRITQESGSRAVDPRTDRTFHVGDELTMHQWGRAGRPVERDSWWTSFDIDGAHIIDAAAVEVVRVLSEKDPWIANCDVQKVGGVSYNRCRRDVDHSGPHRDLYGEEW